MKALPFSFNSCKILKLVQLFSATCSLVKDLEFFFKSSQIVPGDLPVGNKYKDFSKVVKLFQATCSLVKNTMIFQESGQILLSNLPVGEKYKYFLVVVQLFQTTCLLVRNRNSFRKWFNCSKQPTYW
jgi:hypothetical protein